MKYLKKFNESIKNIDDDVIQTIKDILLPISDMGYEISVVKDNRQPFDREEGHPQLIIRVVTFLNEPLLVNDEVKEEFIRMSEYLESEGFNSIMAYYVTKIGKFNAGQQVFKLDFNEFIKNDFELSQLIFIAKA